MSLKQSVVIVSEFTVKTPDGGGSRGASPGEYVLRYMARMGATEDLTPVVWDQESFVTRYMARSEAVDRAGSIPELKQDMRDIQGDGGIGFGYGDVSLSHKKIHRAARDIQKCFDEGKTVMKTVISFDGEYLARNHIVPEGFFLEQEGDYRGNIDQMKLRMAIMRGMDRMSRDYDDLQYVGVIQVDTKHVHCHLAMVDRGKGTLMPNGQQRGMLSERSMMALRRGIDSFLDEKRAVKYMSANVEHDRRNTICYVKKYTHRAMNNRGFAQFLLACLPEDRRMWRAGTNRKEMQKANSIVRGYVEELLSKPDSGYTEALRRVDEYTKGRVQSDGLTGEEYRSLYEAGRQSIVRGCMDTVYSVLSRIPDGDFSVSTPMLDAMSLPYEVMANEADSDPMVEFGFKLRSYGSRLSYHRNERRKYHEAVRNYEEQAREGNTDETSLPLYEYFKIEEEYNAMLMSKYQHFLRFLPPEEEYLEEYMDIVRYGDRLDRLGRMMDDPSLRRMGPVQAEEYGLRVYDEPGGQYVRDQRPVLEVRAARMRDDLASMRDEYRVKLAEHGMSMDADGQPVQAPEYAFDDVKALDLHHLFYDFPYDFDVSYGNMKAFTAMADRRRTAFEAARSYLVSTGQEAALADMPVADIEAQSRAAGQFRDDPMLASRREKPAGRRKMGRTIRMDNPYFLAEGRELENLIRETVNSLQYE